MAATDPDELMGRSNRQDFEKQKRGDLAFCYSSDSWDVLHRPASNGTYAITFTNGIPTAWTTAVIDTTTITAAYLEIHGKTSNAADLFEAYLYNVTDAAYISGSQCETNGTSITRVRSSSFSLTTGTKVYRVDFGGIIGATYTLKDAVVIYTTAAGTFYVPFGSDADDGQAYTP